MQREAAGSLGSMRTSIAEKRCHLCCAAKMASRKCKNDVNSFCYICGEFIKVRAKKFSLSTNIRLREAYKAYFNLTIRSQDKIWAPKFSCGNCKNTLEGKRVHHNFQGY